MKVSHTSDHAVADLQDEVERLRAHAAETREACALLVERAAIALMSISVGQETPNGVQIALEQLAAAIRRGG